MRAALLRRYWRGNRAPLPVAATKPARMEKSPKRSPFCAFGRVGREDRIERGDDAGVIEVLGIELRQARAVEGRAEIEVVAARSFADEADLGEIGPRAAVRAAGHADDDVVGGSPCASSRSSSAVSRSGR